MRHYSLIFLFVVALIPGGCAAFKAACPRNAVAHEKVRERLNIITRMEYVPVYVTTEIPAITELHRNVPDSVDIIENDYAVSSVIVHGDGSFDHCQEVKPRKSVDTLIVPIQVSDTSHFEEHVLTQQETVTETVEINVLKWWQKTLMWCGVAMLALILIWILTFVIKIFLKTKR